ncbi:component of SufBCD complex [Falsirhodobacter sp. 1013]|uniref:component of SufBCD complex n=1 Tax=Falsirhodobacter sp. 1013 TaxID=3417566 RepID=UPI003EB72C44
MQWYELVFSAISLRSFSVLWFWIALAGFWTIVTRNVMGVPQDVILNARTDARAAEEMLWLTRFHVRRKLAMPAGLRVALVAVVAFVLSGLLALALAGLDAAQALFLMGAPWALIEALRLRLAHRLAAEAPDAETLANRLIWHRIMVQAIATTAIFITLIWGVWRVLSLSI